MSPALQAVAKKMVDSFCEKPLSVVISGSHLYGFESHDSDVDVRGVFVEPLKNVLSIRGPKETVERTDKTSTPECDVVFHELRKFCRLLLAGNGNALEQCFSPLVVSEAPEFAELRKIAAKCISKKSYYHFYHFGRGQLRDAIGGKRPTVKALLYAYRPLMAGIFLLRTGIIKPNIVDLNEVFQLDEVNELVARKIEGDEKGTLDPKDLAHHQAKIEDLALAMNEVRERSPLPEEPTCRDEMDAFILKLRLSNGWR